MEWWKPQKNSLVSVLLDLNQAPLQFKSEALPMGPHNSAKFLLTPTRCVKKTVQKGEKITFQQTVIFFTLQYCQILKILTSHFTSEVSTYSSTDAGRCTMHHIKMHPPSWFPRGISLAFVLFCALILPTLCTYSTHEVVPVHTTKAQKLWSHSSTQ